MAFVPSAQAPKGLWRRTPPAIFPSMMGLFGLGMAWRRGHDAIGIPAGVAEALLGAATLLYLFGLLAYLAKVIRRPAVFSEDLRILPGRAGLSAMVLNIYLLGSVAVPYDTGLARFLLFTGFVAHSVLLAVLIGVMIKGPPEGRRVTPVWHLNFVGFVVAALTATQLDLDGLARPILFVCAAFVLGIWSVSLAQLRQALPPAPLRPLLVIHLAPAALLGLVAQALELAASATALAAIGMVIFGTLLFYSRWLTEAGFSPFWGSFTFPTAATAALWLSVGGLWLYPGLMLLATVTFLIPLISLKVMQAWAKGDLAVRTNAATA